MGKTLRDPGHPALMTALWQARLDAGLTQAEPAERLKRPLSFVAKYENGERRVEVVALNENVGLAQIQEPPHPVDQIPEALLTAAPLDTSCQNIRDALLFGQIYPDQIGYLAKYRFGEPAKNALHDPVVNLPGFNNFIKNKLAVPRDTVLPLHPSEVVEMDCRTTEDLTHLAGQPCLACAAVAENEYTLKLTHLDLLLSNNPRLMGRMKGQ